MKARRVERQALDHTALAGAVIAHDVRADSGEVCVHKGQVLRDEDVAVLQRLRWDEIHVLDLEPDDVHELEAGERIACAAAGDEVEVASFGGGHWPLRAMRRGIVSVRTDALRQVNLVEGACVYTLFHGHVVDAGETVARAKVIPFALPGDHVVRAERAARAAGGAGMVSVRSFRPARIAAVVQESLGPGADARFASALGEKVGWLGSELLPPVVVAPEPADIARALDEQRRLGADVIVVAGTRAMDELDPAFLALAALGAERVRSGVPAHPGSLFWIARLERVPVLGLPTCGLFSRATVFDLVLPRILTGEQIGALELAELGHGGYLTSEMTFRFPPYRSGQRRGQVEDE